MDYYPKAYKEVYEILKCVSEEDKQKIDKEMLETIEKNMDKSYEYHLKEDVEFEEQEMLKETRNLLALIYIEYWASKEERAIIMRKYENDLQKKEEEKQKKYAYEDIFKKADKSEEAEISQNQELAMVEIQEKWYQKIWQKIKRFFERRL